MSDELLAGVIFDMDGVLVDSAAAHFQSWKRLAEEHDARITEEQFARTFGLQNRDIIPLLFGNAGPEGIARLGKRKEEIYRELVRREVSGVPGAVDLVRDLHDAGVRLAVGSSGPLENIELILGGMGVGECFRAIVSAADVAKGKPDPQVFALAADRLGLPAWRCVVVEDAPAGVEAAHAAGAKAVAVLMHHPASAFDGADLVVNRLSELSVGTLTALAMSNSEHVQKQV